MDNKFFLVQVNMSTRSANISYVDFITSKDFNDFKLTNIDGMHFIRGRILCFKPQSVDETMYRIYYNGNSSIDLPKNKFVIVVK